MTSKKKSNLLLILFIIVTVVFSAVVVTGVSKNYNSRRVKSRGKIKAVNVEVFWDRRCRPRDKVNEIDWGGLKPSDSISKKIYIKHNSESNLILSVSSSDWYPVEAGNYLTLTCDKEGVIMGNQEVVEATLILTVSNEISGITNFSLNIVIQGINNS